MGTPQRINIQAYANSTGVFETRPLGKESLIKATNLLNMNHDNYHIYIHNLGLHNHILHHLLAILALGGTAEQLSQAYDLAVDSQRSTRPPDARIVSDLADPEKFKLFLGKGKYYDDYFAFFQNEISEMGISSTVTEFLFKGDARAEDMLQRFFSGFLHSPIHLGYAMEFEQPLVVAEALALTAIHDCSFGQILAQIEEVAQHSLTSESLINLQRAIHDNEKLRKAMDYTYGISQIRDGLLVNAKEEFMRLMSAWKVQPHELEEKTAESLNSTLYWTTLAQRPDKQLRFDFFLMHSITAGSLWPVFNSVSWIAPEMKCRLLEWKGRADLMLYCQSGAPTLQPDELTTYQPRFPSEWSEVFRRACDYKDDGHLVKFIRGIATAEQITRSFAAKPQFMLKTADQFLNLSHMVIDSAEQFNLESADQETEMICAKYEYPRMMSTEIQRVTARWPRHVGFEESWFHVPARKLKTVAHI
ncbi:uncharacterized protein N7484_010190 [Penicillium longicatenatum]|uniref:uncharacterized protein n=1 Tax=Penicillium longicatenatum TaxID=1561947 RepID=UPI002546BEAE|nr:uncharacterized protein N7484_010190 [Penicillium longicatenatum]KAJ5636877.1 hypothetical protein N7484_010190 [Penicillium longicatenatum]